MTANKASIIILSAVLGSIFEFLIFAPNGFYLLMAILAGVIFAYSPFVFPLLNALLAGGGAAAAAYILALFFTNFAGPSFGYVLHIAAYALLFGLVTYGFTQN